MNRQALQNRLRAVAHDLGLVAVGFASARPFRRGGAALRSWLEANRHGGLRYMTGPDRSDPAVVSASARTLMVIASAHDGDAGDVARYARGEDYHTVLREKLAELSEVVGDAGARACVDTAPLLEREAAMRAGVGFIGKSTMTIVPGVGSHVLLGELLMDVELTPDPPCRPRCGRCDLCLKACPTAAFVRPFVLDARRCISTLTIEHRGPIPRALRPLMGTRVFGCDVCQEVCPYNHGRRPRRVEPRLSPRTSLTRPDLVALLRLRSGEYRRLVRGTALARASRTQLSRNAAVALGNAGDRSAVPALAASARDHKHPLVRGHALWALGRLGARDAIEPALADDDDSVREEARLALQESSTTTGA
jgi:epoxyqueuosine reductase